MKTELIINVSIMTDNEFERLINILEKEDIIYQMRKTEEIKRVK